MSSDTLSDLDEAINRPLFNTSKSQNTYHNTPICIKYKKSRVVFASRDTDYVELYKNNGMIKSKLQESVTSERGLQ